MKRLALAAITGILALTLTACWEENKPAAPQADQQNQQAAPQTEPMAPQPASPQPAQPEAPQPEAPQAPQPMDQTAQ